MMQTNAVHPPTWRRSASPSGRQTLEEAFLHHPAKRRRTSGALSGSVTPESKSPLKPSDVPCRASGFQQHSYRFVKVGVSTLTSKALVFTSSCTPKPNKTCVGEQNSAQQ
jgi:hypothetical protein